MDSRPGDGRIRGRRRGTAHGRVNSFPKRQGASPCTRASQRASSRGTGLALQLSFTEKLHPASAKASRPGEFDLVHSAVDNAVAMV